MAGLPGRIGFLGPKFSNRNKERNSKMSWLKKVGQILAKGFGLAKELSPIVAAVVPGAGMVISDIGLIGNIIVSIEAAFSTLPAGTTGADKLRAAVPLVAQIVEASQLVSGKKIADPVKFTAAITEITSGFADLLNSLEAPK
jgi:hypothetical protein